MTKKLFEENPYQTEFTTNITTDKQNDKGEWEIVLDQTCFYPEGGGQASDTGTLNGIEVIKLYKTPEGEIVHVVDSRFRGNDKEVKGQIDWERRFAHMQQHSGQHILSAAIYTLFGLQTIQAKFDATEGWILLERALTEEEIDKALELASKIVFENKDITTKYIPLEEMGKYPLVKAPKEKFAKTGKIRIWHIEGFYSIPCGGTHVAKTGEVGLIMILKQTKEGANTKVFFTTGSLSLSRFREMQKEVQKAAEKTLQTLKTQEQRIKYLQQEWVMLQQQSLQSQQQGPYTLYQFSYDSSSQPMLRGLFSTLIQKQNTIVIATSATLPLAIAWNKEDTKIGPLLKELLIKHHGKGGGNFVYWQAAGIEQEAFVKDFLSGLLK